LQAPLAKDGYSIIKRFETPVDNFSEMVSVEEDLSVHEKMDRQYSIMRGAMGKIGEPCKSLLEAFYVHHKNMQENSLVFWLHKRRQR
jgi:hypothetical protein